MTRCAKMIGDQPCYVESQGQNYLFFGDLHRISIKLGNKKLHWHDTSCDIESCLQEISFFDNRLME